MKTYKIARGTDVYISMELPAWTLITAKRTMFFDLTDVCGEDPGPCVPDVYNITFYLPENDRGYTHLAVDAGMVIRGTA